MSVKTTGMDCKIEKYCCYCYIIIKMELFSRLKTQTNTKILLQSIIIIIEKNDFFLHPRPPLFLKFPEKKITLLFVCVRAWVHGWVCSLYYDRSPQNVPRHFPFGTPDKTSAQSDIYRHHQHLRGTLPHSNLRSHPLNIPSSSVRMHPSCMGHFSEIHWKQHNNTADS